MFIFFMESKITEKSLFFRIHCLGCKTFLRLGKYDMETAMSTTCNQGCRVVCVGAMELVLASSTKAGRMGCPGNQNSTKVTIVVDLGKH